MKPFAVSILDILAQKKWFCSFNHVFNEFLFGIDENSNKQDQLLQQKKLGSPKQYQRWKNPILIPIYSCECARQMLTDDLNCKGLHYSTMT